MKALTVKQPWAGAILLGGKDVENRTWATDFRGTLVIHAGKSVDGDARVPRTGHGQRPVSSRLSAAGTRLRTPLDAFAGAAIGVVEVLDCVPMEDADLTPWRQWSPGSFCWVLSEPRVFVEPVVLPGKLQLWDVPESVASAAGRAVSPEEWLEEHAAAALRRWREEHAGFGKGVVYDPETWGSLD